MKRSVVIGIISYKLKELGLTNSLELYSEDILRALEFVGMAPPAYREPCSDLGFVNSWSPETFSFNGVKLDFAVGDQKVPYLLYNFSEKAALAGEPGGFAMFDIVGESSVAWEKMIEAIKGGATLEDLQRHDANSPWRTVVFK